MRNFPFHLASVAVDLRLIQVGDAVNGGASMKNHWLLAVITSGLLLLGTSGTVMAAGLAGPVRTTVTQSSLEIDDSRVRPLPQTKQARLLKVNLTGAAIVTASGGIGLACWYRAHRYHA